MKQYSPTGSRNHGRPLKRLLDTWDQKQSTSGPTPRQIYDDDDSNYNIQRKCVHNVCVCVCEWLNVLRQGAHRALGSSCQTTCSAGSSSMWRRNIPTP
jgi:hypothetical protein